MSLKDLKQIEDVRQRLTNDEISAKTAYEDIKTLTNNFKSWTTPYWKNFREKFLDNTCVECGAKASDGVILVVQHGWKPNFKSTVFIDKTFEMLMTESKYSAIRETSKELALKEYPLEPPLSDLCPSCGFKSISYRKKTMDYRCSKCKTEFDIPAKGVSSMDKRSYEDKEAVQRRIDYRFKNNLRETAFEMVKNDETIQKIVHLAWIEDNLRYLRFEGAKTACKRCAFLEDRVDDNLIMCPICQINRIPESNIICKSCTFDKTTGIYTLTSEKALRWFRSENKHAEKCAEGLTEKQYMIFFACLLKKQGLDVTEISELYLRVKTEQKFVYEALSDRKSLF